MAGSPDPTARWAQALTDGADYPVYVATASDGVERSGCLVGFVTQASIEPVRYLICLSKLNHTFPVARRSRGLALHLLGADQKELARVFGEETGDVVDKFAGLAWTTATTGAPVLADCAGWIDGSILGQVDAGDHQAFLVAVVDGGPGSRQGHLRRSDVTDFHPGHPAGR